MCTGNEKSDEHFPTPKGSEEFAIATDENDLQEIQILLLTLETAHMKQREFDERYRQMQANVVESHLRDGWLLTLASSLSGPRAARSVSSHPLRS
jgi:UDP-N-acetyl-D-mannosaminuronate dehydrogenase